VRRRADEVEGDKWGSGSTSEARGVGEAAARARMGAIKKYFILVMWLGVELQFDRGAD
jgi:hypothetical protein